MNPQHASVTLPHSLSLDASKHAPPRACGLARVMTKFDPVAKGERGSSRGPSAAQRRREMELFRATGTHPELEAAARERAATAESRARVANARSQKDSRPKAYLDLVNGDGERVGSVVAELFEDLAPRACARFERRTTSDGDADGVSYEGCGMVRVVDGLRVHFGGGSCGRARTKMESEGALTHAAACVGMDRETGEFVVVTEACELLDASSQVVGRVIAGLEILRAMTHPERGMRPPKGVTIVACGVVKGACDVSALVGIAANGRFEAAAKARAAAEQRRNETQADTMKRLREESAAKGAEISEMVRSTLASKNKDEDAPTAAKKSKGGMLDYVLGDAGTSSDSEED